MKPEPTSPGRDGDFYFDGAAGLSNPEGGGVSGTGVCRICD